MKRLSTYLSWLTLCSTTIPSISAEFRAAFGSCNHQDLEVYAEPVLEAITDENVNEWWWLGDIGYLDNRLFLWFSKPYPIDVMKKGYDKVKKGAAYQRLLQSVDHVRGIWDDHDYGVNGGDESYAAKDESQKLLLNFLDEPLDSARWTRPGVYDAVDLPEGTAALMVMLDGRYFRRPGHSLLGDEQWMWLETTVRDSDAKLVVLLTGTPFHTNYFGGDNWDDFPDDQTRLLRLIDKQTHQQFLILSGDLHLAQATCFTTPRGRKVYEVTCSGISHAWGEVEAVTPSHHTIDAIGRSDPFVMRYWVSLVLRAAIAVCGQWYGSMLQADRYYKRNYGVLTIRDDGSWIVEVKNATGSTIFTIPSNRTCPAFSFDSRFSYTPFLIGALLVPIGTLLLWRRRKR